MDILEKELGKSSKNLFSKSKNFKKKNFKLNIYESFGLFFEKFFTITC